MLISRALRASSLIALSIPTCIACPSGGADGQGTQQSAPPLPRIARKVADTSELVRPFYHWITQDTLRMYSGRPGHEWLQHIYELDLSKGRKRYFDEFMTRFHQTAPFKGSEREHYLNTVALSPDGTRMIYHPAAFSGAIGQAYMYIVSMDASEWYRVPPLVLQKPHPPLEGTPVWSADGQCILFIKGGTAIVASTKGEYLASVDLTGAPQKPPDETWTVRWSGRVGANRYSIIYRNIPSNPPKGGGFRWIVYEFAWNDCKAQDEKSWTIRFPVPDDVLQLDRSHTGERLVWSIDVRRDAEQFIEIWVSDARGNRARRVAGPLEVPLNPWDKIPDAQRFAPKWLPDDRAISFMYKGSLWVLPIKDDLR